MLVFQMVVTRQVQQLNVTDEPKKKKLEKELQQMCEEQVLYTYFLVLSMCSYLIASLYSIGQLEYKRKRSVASLSNFHTSPAPSKARSVDQSEHVVDEESKVAPNLARKRSFIIKGGRVQLIETVASMEVRTHLILTLTLTLTLILNLISTLIPTFALTLTDMAF
jgi:hypothetical protein